MLSTFLAAVFAADATAQERPSTAGVRDEAGMFSEEAIRQAGDSLRTLGTDSGVVAVVETVANLGGEKIEEAAVRMARRSAIKGIFVLAARKEMQLEVLSSRQLRDAIPREELHKIRLAFADGFRKSEFDRGLKEGVAAIKEVVARATSNKKSPAPNEAVHAAAIVPAAKPSSLVVRGQIKLTLEGARAIIDAAEKKAQAMNLKANIAVVDDGGHLLSFDRMNGARPASVATAITKAVSAATFRQSSGPIPAGASTPDPILNLSIQNAAALGGSKVTSLKGGEPVRVDDQVIGGVGVGGGTGEQDAEIARAGIDAFLKQLAAPDPPPPGEDRGKAGASPAPVKD